MSLSLYVPDNHEFDSIYGLYEYKDVSSFEFVNLYEDSVNFFDDIKERREFLFFKQIESSIGKICVIPRDDQLTYLLVWDHTYWKQFKVYLEVYENAYLLYSSDIVSDERNQLFTEEMHYLFANWSLFLYSILLPSYPQYADAFRIDADSWMRQSKHLSLNTTVISERLSISKRFVLFHEFEHILHSWGKNIYQKNIPWFDNTINKYKQLCVDNPDSVDDLPITDIITALELLLDKNQTSTEDKDEVYNDIHAFFELLRYEAFHKYRNFDKYYMLYTELDKYYLPIKILKFFETDFNFLKNATDLLLSTLLWKSDKRNKTLTDWQHHNQINTILKRDYLSCELIRYHFLSDAQNYYSQSQWNNIRDNPELEDYMLLHDRSFHPTVKKYLTYALSLIKSVTTV